MKLRYYLLAYFMCIAYASVYPFREWKDASLLIPGALDFFNSGMPRFWTGFDVIANVLVYVPLGLMLSWVLQTRLRSSVASALAFLASSCFSLLVEWVQVILPSRVPSLLDWLLNSFGALLGALLAIQVARKALDEWLHNKLRFVFDREAPVREARAWLLMLLVLWMLAQLAPQSLAFAVGDFVSGAQRSQVQVSHVYGPLLEASATAFSVVVIGLLMRPLLGPSVNPVAPTLAVFAAATLMKAAFAAWFVGASAAFGWFSAAAQGGLLIGLSALSVVAMAVRMHSRRFWSVVLCSVIALVVMFNLAPASNYHLNLMRTWSPKPWRAMEGILHWLGVLWPMLVVVYCVRRISN
jgi:VanZ family protein